MPGAMATMLAPSAEKGLGAGGAEGAIAVCDVSTGTFDVAAVDPAALADVLMAWPLSELLAADADSGKPPIISATAASAAPVTWRPARAATHKTGEALLKEAFDIAAIDAGIGGAAVPDTADIVICDQFLRPDRAIDVDLPLVGQFAEATGQRQRIEQSGAG